MGAHVIATSSSAAKLERLAALGADQVINYRSIPEVQDPDGKGVDHVVEVGGPQTLQQSILAARIGGHISLIGVRSEEHTSELQSLMRISYAVFCLKKKKYKDTL